MSTEAEHQPLADTFNFAQHLLTLNTKRANKIAYIDDTGSLDYGELNTRVQRFASSLLTLGVHREERVLLIMNDCFDLPIAFLGAIYAGIIPVPVNTLLTPDDYTYLLENTRAQAVVISDPLIPKLTNALNMAQHDVKNIIVSNPSEKNSHEFITMSELTADSVTPVEAAKTAPNDQGFWLYSSGSTGRPKGTVHTQANPYWTAKLYGSQILALTENDICFSAAKLFFAYGLGNAMTFPLSVGATTILMAERPTPDAVFQRLTEHQATVFFGAPTGYAGMLASPSLPTKNQVSLRLASSAGEALPAEIGQRFSAHYGIDLVDGIGSTEMLHIYLSNRPGQIRYGTTGWPVPGYQVELRNKEGQAVACGEAGDLYVNGPSSAIMYWANRTKSQETFFGEWLKTGDTYVQNDDGTFTYSGRSDDMIKVSGIYVSPFEVEATLIEHPAVFEAAVIGEADKEDLIKTKAFVVLKPGQSSNETELKAFVKERLAPYKYPRSIEFVTELPKTATGKIQRFKLRK
ncbi:MAG: benzoate-CoA ligase family protein [Spongiibacteraceae bacterium]|nr:benzoate-CoA ligase family protein [Spongiibacteraceae bacterium]